MKRPSPVTPAAPPTLLPLQPNPLLPNPLPPNPSRKTGEARKEWTEVWG
ncbi:hypothetical protein GCM10010327_18250 [Streptomyces nitrosporeus]|nr:hypothetical protein GCM10010327_18250 [Streptomyces nitrosporeus]